MSCNSRGPSLALEIGVQPPKMLLQSTCGGLQMTYADPAAVVVESRKHLCSLVAVAARGEIELLPHVALSETLAMLAALLLRIERTCALPAMATVVDGMRRGAQAASSSAALATTTKCLKALALSCFAGSVAQIIRLLGSKYPFAHMNSSHPRIGVGLVLDSELRQKLFGSV
jgi:hypothetical protein